MPCCAAAAARLAAGIEAGDDLALRVHDLGLAVDPKTAIGIEHADARRRRVERRRVDPVQDRLLEVFVLALVRERVVPRDRLLQVLQRHLLMRMPHDLLGQLGKRVGLVEVAVGRVGDVGIADLASRRARPRRNRRSPRPVRTRSREPASPRSWRARHPTAADRLYCALTCAVLALRQSSGTNGLRVPSLPGGYLASLEMSPIARSL